MKKGLTGELDLKVIHYLFETICFSYFTRNVTLFSLYKLDLMWCENQKQNVIVCLMLTSKHIRYIRTSIF